MPKHGVSIAEIEGLFDRPHSIHVDVEHSLGEERLKAIGKGSKGRYIFPRVHDPRAERRAFHPAHQRPLHPREGGGAL